MKKIALAALGLVSFPFVVVYGIGALLLDFVRTLGRALVTMGEDVYEELADRRTQ